ncbi:MAG TPA: acyl carrier protein [Geminicoccaceae bacterium]|nr:acyl carrier protein [Geminicoccaceae bacterium]
MDDRLREIVAELFDLEPALVRDELTPEDVELWDSLNHLRLVSAVEEEFQIKLSMQQIESIRSLAGLRALIEQRPS